ncbi:hypothetical protein AB0K00_52530 [Dactylosporangium sp. NPDC049525]|uniref:hypothetical protein n=1 Tax=Dactylosporangium sp. NPDC049525 TaxID=3154730 RepID=UPI003427C02B
MGGVVAGVGEEIEAGLGAGVVGRTTDGRRLFLLDRRGWVRAGAEDGGRIREVIRPVPGGGRIVVELDPGVFAGWPDGAGKQTVTAVRVETDPAGGHPPPVAGQAPAGPGPGDSRAGTVVVDPVTFSETVRDLLELVT